MTIREVMTAMNIIAPPQLAEEWDNIGLLFGDPDATVTSIVVALDVTPEAVAYAKTVGAQLIVTHHPLIFSPVKRVLAPSTLHHLAVSGVAAFAAHTNLDAADGGVNDVLAAVLGLENVQPAFDGIGRVGVLPEALSPTAFAELVRERLHTAVQLRVGTAAVKTVALVSGSGGDFAEEACADAFVTGEIKHHEWLSLPDTLTVVAAGHYATENVVVKPLADRLCEMLSLPCYPFDGHAPYITV